MRGIAGCQEQGTRCRCKVLWECTNCQFSTSELSDFYVVLHFNARIQKTKQVVRYYLQNSVKVIGD